MLPFECLGEDGKVYLHNDNWRTWVGQRCEEYPRPPGRFRFDVEIAHPRRRLSDVPTDFNPHTDGRHSATTCFYSCADWSSIFGVYDAHHPSGRSLRMVVENGHSDPLWGERIRLMSTSSDLGDPPGHRANVFALFRGQYWKVTSRLSLQVLPRPAFYPISSYANRHVRHPLAISPDLIYKEIETFRNFEQGIPSQWIQMVGDHFENASIVIDRGPTVAMGATRLVDWRYNSDCTEPSRYISLSASGGHAIPEVVAELGDLKQAVIYHGASPARYHVERIANSVDRGPIHFRVLEVLGAT